jgi:hypothetical protein
MNKDNSNKDNISTEDLFLNLIDEKRNKDMEIRFSLYIKKVFSFDENKYSEKHESENDEDIDKHLSHIIKIIFKTN